MVNPILKWAGGKRQLLSDIKRVFPKDWDKYHEPFLGGGAVILSVEPSDGTVNDLNSDLVNLYRTVKEHPRELISENKTHSYEEEYYYDARDEFNSLSAPAELTSSEQIRKASLLLYLNRTGYNGLYRVNSNGEFNVPFGEHMNPDFVQEQRIQQLHRVLQKIEIFNKDFEYIRETAEKGDLVYFDPPYEPVSETADFTEYQADGFEKDDQRRLCKTAQELDSKGVSVIISNSPPVAELYEDLVSFTTESVRARRSINRDSDNRSAVDEILITNVDPGERVQQKLTDY